MTNLLEKVKDMVGMNDEYDEYEYEEEVVEEELEEPILDNKATESNKNGKVVNLHSSVNSGVKVMIYEPKSYDEVTKIIDELKDRKLIVINMLGLESEKKSHLFHCLSGAIYAIEGNMQKVAKDIFVLAPSNIEVDSNKITEEIGSKGIFPWQK